MTFELKLRAVVFKEARGHGERLYAELIPVNAPGSEQKGQVAYFNTVASFISRLDRAGLQEDVSAEIRNALDAVFRAPGILVRVQQMILDRAQLVTLGFRTLAPDDAGRRSRVMIDSR